MIGRKNKNKSFFIVWKETSNSSRGRSYRERGERRIGGGKRGSKEEKQQNKKPCGEEPDGAIASVVSTDGRQTFNKFQRNSPEVVVDGGGVLLPPASVSLLLSIIYSLSSAVGFLFVLRHCLGNAMDKPPNPPFLTDVPLEDMPEKKGGNRDVALFTSSLPTIRYGKLNFVDSNQDILPVDDTASKSNKLLKDVEGRVAADDLNLHGIGNFLPDDEDLLAGVADDFDLSGLPSQLEDLDDNDIFFNGGGMELDLDPMESLNFSMAQTSINDGYVVNGNTQYNLPNGVGAVAGEHPYGEHPSRTLFVRNINSNVEDSELRSLFEQYGAIRSLYTACKQRGFVMISYYDIRDARNAMRALQNKPLRRRKLDIHFSIPKDNPSDKDMNQGTLVIFNLDSSVSNDDLLQIFGAYGEVKEIRETPHKRHHKFIEFYDVRAAEAALRALNRSDIAGKRIKLEPSRPGGARRNLIQQLGQELDQDESRVYRQQVGSPITNSPPVTGTWAQFSSPTDNSPLQALNQSPTMGSFTPTSSNPLQGLASIIPLPSNSVKIPPIGKDYNRINHADQAFTSANLTNGVAFHQSHSFSDQGGGIFSNMNSSPGSMPSFHHSTTGASSVGLNGPQFLWGSPSHYSEQSRSAAWPAASVGHSFTSNGQGKAFPYSNHHGSLLASSHHYHGHHVGSAPSGVPFERHFGYIPESPETSFMGSAAYGGMSLGRNEVGLMMNMGGRAAMHPLAGMQGNVPENGSPGFRMTPPQRLGNMFLCGTYSGPGYSGLESLVEHGRSRRIESNGSQVDSKKQYQLQLDKIISGEDTRTTVMIKNIPNKYTSKMLMAAIDESHEGTYDFVYLPIDFKNKCNVGYAFINMVSPSHIITFYEAFNGKKWEKFNSEKVASLAYARIQGRVALTSHFQNSSLMNEDKRCRPILFNSEGLDADDQEAFQLRNVNIQACQLDGPSFGELHGSPPMNLNGKSGVSPGRR